jgi:hypothetical protein
LLHLTLPAQAQFWFAFVNQNSVWPWRDREQILVPLEQHSKIGAATTVELFYTSQVGRPRQLDLQLLGPKFDLPLEGITWRVHLGDKWRLKDATGTLQLQAQGVVDTPVVVDLDTYVRTEASFLQTRTKEAEQMLTLANNYLNSGDPQQARRAFQAAYGLSQHDNAFNEDARVQLHNLKMQQALVGLNVRQSAQGGETTNAPAQRLRELDAAKTPTYTQAEAKQLLERNTAEDNTAQMKLAERLIQQQDAAVANPAAIRASIPEQGRVLTFTRALLVDPWADLKLGIELAAVKSASSWLKLGVLTGVFVVLAVLAGLARWQQRAD